MRWTGPIAAAAIVAALSGVPASAIAAQRGPNAGANGASATDFSAQSGTERRRPRIRVTPRRYYRNFHSPYPLPYDVEYPGSNAVRDCRAKLVQETRPSGVVIVPRMRCRWVQG